MAKAKLSPAATKKQDQPPEVSSPDVERLAKDVAAVLQNPACPELLFNGITNSLSEIETMADTLTPTFLSGLFLSPVKGGAA